MSGPIEAEKAARTRRSVLKYVNLKREIAMVDVYDGIVTIEVRLLCQLGGQPSPFPEIDDRHITRISVEQMDELLEKNGFYIEDAEHKWV